MPYYIHLFVYIYEYLYRMHSHSLRQFASIWNKPTVRGFFLAIFQQSAKHFAHARKRLLTFNCQRNVSVHICMYIHIEEYIAYIESGCILNMCICIFCENNAKCYGGRGRAMGWPTGWMVLSFHLLCTLLLNTLHGIPSRTPPPSVDATARVKLQK